MNRPNFQACSDRAEVVGITALRAITMAHPTRVSRGGRSPSNCRPLLKLLVDWLQSSSDYAAIELADKLPELGTSVDCCATAIDPWTLRSSEERTNDARATVRYVRPAR